MNRRELKADSCSAAGFCMFAIVLITACTNYPDNGPAEKTRLRLLTIATVLDTYRNKRGRFPNSDEGLSAATKLAGVKAVAERALLHDGWGAPFVYRAANPLVVYSIGPNQIDEKRAGDDVTMESVVPGR